jgi:hypothetical protein
MGICILITGLMKLCSIKNEDIMGRMSAQLVEIIMKDSGSIPTSSATSDNGTLAVQALVVWRSGIGDFGLRE